MFDEERFREANGARRDERARLTGRQTKLTEWLAQQRDRQEAVSSLLTRVRSFLEDVQELDTRAPRRCPRRSSRPPTSTVTDSSNSSPEDSKPARSAMHAVHPRLR